MLSRQLHVWTWAQEGGPGWRQGSLKAYNRLRPMFVLVLKILFHLELNSAMSSFVGGSPKSSCSLLGFPQKTQLKLTSSTPSLSCSFISFLSDIYGVKSTSPYFCSFLTSLTTASTKSALTNFPNSAHRVLLSSLHSNQPLPEPLSVQLWLQQSCFVAWFSSCRSRYSGFVSLDALSASA